jgi:hypothetical protein
MRGVLRFLIGTTLVVWGAARWVFGYIDPNTGGMLFQLLAVFFAFSSAIILFFSRQIRVGLARITRLVRDRFTH